MKTQKEKESLIEQLKKTPIIQLACERTGISRATYYRWRKEDQQFAKNADEALIEGILLVNDMAESQLMSAIREKNMTAIIYWLRHHHPSYTNRVEISGRLTHSDEELTPEQMALVKTALRLASFDKNHEKEK
ncbi:MAG: hypothetical protein DDT40_00614 [candidate division WS2 bacterium]|nr:hypothetical protein [Candidatus Psychracetigena formicireducens]